MSSTTTLAGLRVLPWGLLLGLLSPASLAQEGGIEVLAASTLFDSGTRVSLTHIYKRKESGSRGLEREEHLGVLGVDHGLLPDLTVSTLIPFVDEDVSSGLGDVALLAKYRAHKVDWRRGSANFSVIGGLELPTGKTSESGPGGRVPPGLQPGSGSWDPIVALASNLSHARVRFDTLALYKLNTEGTAGFEAGDFLVLEGSAAYRFWHEPYPGDSASVRLGLQWRDEAAAERNGVRVPNTGGDQVLLRLGLGWHPIPRVDLSLAVDLPVHRDLNGSQLGLETRTVLALGLRF